MIIDGIKYACERCIRGHRVSNCTHSDQPLTRIKPKGRPATQCNHCRDVRKTRQLHTKCLCNGVETDLSGGHHHTCPCHMDPDFCTCTKIQRKRKSVSPSNRKKRQSNGSLASQLEVKNGMFEFSINDVNTDETKENGVQDRNHDDKNDVIRVNANSNIRANGNENVGSVNENVGSVNENIDNVNNNNNNIRNMTNNNNANDVPVQINPYNQLLQDNAGFYLASNTTPLPFNAGGEPPEFNGSFYESLIDENNKMASDNEFITTSYNNYSNAGYISPPLSTDYVSPPTTTNYGPPPPINKANNLSSTNYISPPLKATEFSTASYVPPPPPPPPPGSMNKPSDDLSSNYVSSSSSPPPPPPPAAAYKTNNDDFTTTNYVGPSPAGVPPANYVSPPYKPNEFMTYSPYNKATNGFPALYIGSSLHIPSNKSMDSVLDDSRDATMVVSQPLIAGSNFDIFNDGL